MVKGYNNIPVRNETKDELSRRKRKASWKKNRPKFTWDDYLLESTDKDRENT